MASRVEKNNRVEEPENALTHETRNVTSKTLSAGGVGFGTMVDFSGCGDQQRQAFTSMVEVDPSLVCVRAVALRARGRDFRPVRVQIKANVGVPC